MDLYEYLSALRKRWIAIVAFGLVGGMLAFAYASSMTDLYRSTSGVFLSAAQGSTTSELVQGSTFTQSLIQSYAQLATMPVVLSPVIAELGLDESPTSLAASVTADAPLNTVIIEISVTDPSPKQAARIADAISRSLAHAARTLSPTGADGQASITMTTIAPAQVPNHPFSPNERLLTLTGAIIGLVLGGVYALARALLDTRIRGARDVERAGNVPVIGSIPRRRRSEPEGIALRVSPYGMLADGYRRIRTNLQFADVDNPIRSVTITSSLAAEGKTTAAINLALAVAEREQRVLLIDADLHHPSVANYCQIEGAVGLTTVLVGAIDQKSAIQRWSNGVDILPSGERPANPNQVLGSVGMAKLIESLTAEYDFVIIDSPPILPASDALTIAHMTSGVVVVALHNSTRRQQLTRTLSALEGAKARVLGVVINQANPEPVDAYYFAEEVDRAERFTWRRRSQPTAIRDDRPSSEISADSAELVAVAPAPGSENLGQEPGGQAPRTGSNPRDPEPKRPGDSAVEPDRRPTDHDGAAAKVRRKKPAPKAPDVETVATGTEIPSGS